MFPLPNSFLGMTDKHGIKWLISLKGYPVRSQLQIPPYGCYILGESWGKCNEFTYLQQPPPFQSTAKHLIAMNTGVCIAYHANQDAGWGLETFFSKRPESKHFWLRRLHTVSITRSFSC